MHRTILTIQMIKTQAMQHIKVITSLGIGEGLKGEEINYKQSTWEKGNKLH